MVQDRCIPYFGDEQEGVVLDHLEDDSDSEDDYDSDLENDKRCGPERAYIMSRLQVRLEGIFSCGVMRCDDVTGPFRADSTVLWYHGLNGTFKLI